MSILKLFTAAISGPGVIRSAVEKVKGESFDVLAETMAAVLNSQELRTGLSERGRARAQEFSWEITARKTCACYQQLADGPA